MKATKIYYKKLINLGNYQNEEIGIELEIEEGEKAIDVLEKAILFVEKNNKKSQILEKYSEAMSILENPDNFSYKKVMEAEEIKNNFDFNVKKYQELPF